MAFGRCESNVTSPRGRDPQIEELLLWQNFSAASSPLCQMSQLPIRKDWLAFLPWLGHPYPGKIGLQYLTLAHLTTPWFTLIWLDYNLCTIAHLTLQHLTLQHHLPHPGCVSWIKIWLRPQWCAYKSWDENMLQIQPVWPPHASMMQWFFGSKHR